MKPTDIKATTASVKNTVRKPFYCEDAELIVTTSATDLYAEVSSAAEMLLHASEVAVHHAKAKGGDCIQVYDPKMKWLPPEQV